MWSRFDSVIWWLNLLLMPVNIYTGSWWMLAINAVGLFCMQAIWNDYKRYRDLGI